MKWVGYSEVPYFLVSSNYSFPFSVRLGFHFDSLAQDGPTGGFSGVLSFENI